MANKYMTETILVGVVIGLTEVAKKAGLSSRFAPLLSVILGVTLAVIMQMDWWAGLIVGLMASGLYSGVKATVR